MSSRLGFGKPEGRGGRGSSGPGRGLGRAERKAAEERERETKRLLVSTSTWGALHFQSACPSHRSSQGVAGGPAPPHPGSALRALGVGGSCEGDLGETPAWGGSLQGWAPWLTARCHLYLWAPPAAVGGGGSCRLRHQGGCLFRGVTFWRGEKLFAAALNLRHLRLCLPGPYVTPSPPTSSAPTPSASARQAPALPSLSQPFLVSEPQAWTPFPGSIFPGATLPRLLLQFVVSQRFLDQRVTSGLRTLGALTPQGDGLASLTMNGSFLALGPSAFWDQCHVPISLRSLPGSVLASSSGHRASLPASWMGCHPKQPEPGAQGPAVAESRVLPSPRP